MVILILLCSANKELNFASLIASKALINSEANQLIVLELLEIDRKPYGRIIPKIFRMVFVNLNTCKPTK